MKKLLIIILTVVTAVSVKAQQENNSVTPTKKMSVAEANTLNGNKQPTYQGGKSYSQWVSEEKAKQQGVNMKGVIPQMPEQFKSVAASWTGKPDAVKQSQTVAPQQEEYINKVNPSATKIEPAVITKQEEKTTPSKEAVAIREMLTGQTSVPEDKSTKVVAPLIKGQGSTTEPKTVVSQEEKVVQMQPAKTDAPKTEVAVPSTLPAVLKITPPVSAAENKSTESKKEN